MLMINLNEVTIYECAMYYNQLHIGFVNNNGIKLVIDR